MFGRVLYRTPSAGPQLATYPSGSLAFGTAVRRIGKELAKYLHDRTWKIFYWPDHACLWYQPAVRLTRELIASNNYDALISVSLPFTGHLAGLAVKRRYPALRWLADVGDPFCFLTSTPPNNHRLFNRLNRHYEEEVFKSAERIVVTTEPTLREYKSIFPETSDKLRLIPPLLPPRKKNNTKHFFSGHDKVRLLFSGTLYQNIRNPEFILRLFARLLQTELSEKLELHFLGTLSNCPKCFDTYKDLIGEKVFLHGPVSHGTAIQAMSEADCLVNIGNDTEYQLPSKVVEYASTGKPVLCLAKKVEDSSIGFFRHYPRALCVIDNNAKADADLTGKVLQFLKDPPVLDTKRYRKWLAPFQVPAIARAYESELIST